MNKEWEVLKQLDRAQVMEVVKVEGGRIMRDIPSLEGAIGEGTNNNQNNQDNNQNNNQMLVLPVQPPTKPDWYTVEVKFLPSPIVYNLPPPANPKLPSPPTIVSIPMIVCVPE